MVHIKINTYKFMVGADNFVRKKKTDTHWGSGR
jgi:hypothetical protein